MNWLLALNFYVHMVATIVWVGGITLLTIVVWPAARRMLGPGKPTGEFMAEVQRRFSPLAMLSLAALVVTGLGQMAANPNYEGLFRVSNKWAQAILFKHIAFAVMTVVGAYLTWGLLPALSRLSLLEAAGRAPEELARLRRRQERLHRLNTVCGLIVLAFTAVARAA
ncbi:MAG: CopD family protein [Anaerolineales bacterium]